MNQVYTAPLSVVCASGPNRARTFRPNFLSRFGVWAIGVLPGEEYSIRLRNSAGWTRYGVLFSVDGVDPLSGTPAVISEQGTMVIGQLGGTVELQGWKTSTDTGAFVFSQAQAQGVANQLGHTQSNGVISVAVYSEVRPRPNFDVSLDALRGDQYRGGSFDPGTLSYGTTRSAKGIPDRMVTGIGGDTGQQFQTTRALENPRFEGMFELFYFPSWQLAEMLRGQAEEERKVAEEQARQRMQLPVGFRHSVVPSNPLDTVTRVGASVTFAFERFI